MKPKARYLDLDPELERGQSKLLESSFGGDTSAWHGLKGFDRSVHEDFEGGDYFKVMKSPRSPRRAPVAVHVSRQPEVLEARFEDLAHQWERETIFTSSSHQLVLHAAYQSIIGLGMPAVPLILERLGKSPKQWFWALHHITGASPADENSSVTEAAAAWHRWGVESGFIR